MEILSSAWHVVSAFLVFLFGLFLSITMGRKFQPTRHRTWILYVWHSIFCIVGLFYSIENGGDAITYYKSAADGNIDFTFGTAAINFITYLIASAAGFSILGCFLVYNIFGYIGLLAFDSGLRIVTANKNKLQRGVASLIPFMPSVSFWSSAIGKDALSFMAIGLALWATLDLRRRQWLMVFSVLIMLMVRPHIAGMLVLALGASTALDSKIKFKTRALSGVLAIGASLVLVPLALSYAGLGGASSLVDFEGYIDQRQGYNLEGGSSLDISSMSLPMQMFTYLFRPTIFEATGITSLAAAFDNTLLLLLMALAFVNYFKIRSSQLMGMRNFMWIYVLMAWIVLATTTANLGIAIRQKWMFVPFLVFLLIPFIGKLSGRRNSASSR